jgi:hypothetical protein
MISLVRCVPQRCRAIALIILLLFSRELTAESVQLDNSQECVAIGHDSAFSVDQFTVELWFKQSTGGSATTVNNIQTHPLISRGNAATFFLGVASGRLHGEVQVSDLTRVSVLSPDQIPQDEWHHAALTFDGAWLRLYLDGIQVAEKSINLPLFQSPLTRIGQIAYPGVQSGLWSGRIDEVRVWNRALLSAEIARNRTETITFAPGLLARWGFDNLPDSASVSDGANAIAATLSTGASYSSDSPLFTSLAPTTVLSGPPAPIQVTTSTPLNFAATTTDSDDQVVRVDFYANHTKIGEDTTAPYELTWVPNATGIHMIRAVAEDASGLRNGSSAGSQVVVVSSLGSEATYFDGESAFADAGANASHALSIFTVETRFYMDGNGKPFRLPTTNVFAPSYVALVARNNTATNFNYFLGIDPAENRLVAGLETMQTMARGRTAITRGAWHHAAVTFDGDVMRLFLDGELEAECFFTFDPPVSGTKRLTFGALTTGDAEGPLRSGIFHGALDELRIWNYARSQGAIRNSRHANIANESGLVARWAMDAPIGQTLPATGSSPADANLFARVAPSGGVPPSLGNPPLVTLTSPAAATAVNRDQILPLEATITGPTDGIARVEFWTQAFKVGEDTSPPFSYNWASAPIGTYAMTAVAISTDGSAGVSPQVDVTVNPVVGPGGLYFNGSQGSNTSNTIPSTKRYTLECWFRREGLAQPDRFTFRSSLVGEAIMGLHGSNQPICILGIDPATETLLCVFENTEETLTLRGTQGVAKGEWHHTAFTHDGKILRVYLDGQLEMESETPVPTVTLTHSLNLSRGAVGRFPAFRGHMDEVRFWDHDRSASELSGSRYQFFATYPGLRSRWTFNEGSGTNSQGTGSAPLSLTVPSSAWSPGYTAPSIGIPPTVSISSPTAGSVFPALSSFNVAISASDSDGSIQKVEVYVGSEKVGEDAVAPYIVDVTPTEIGARNLRVVALDNDGNASSHSIPIQMDPPVGNDGLYLDGIDDSVAIQDHPSLDLQQFTVEAWVRKIDSGLSAGLSGGMVPIVVRGGFGSQLNYGLGFHPLTGQPMAAMSTVSGSLRTAVGPTPIAAGAWHHFAATYDGTALRLYVDGELAATTAVVTVPFSRPFQRTGLGAFTFDDGSTAGALDGFIDEVRIWDHARSGVAIAADRWKVNFNDPSLKARWAMSEGTGNQILSSQSPSISGAISGAKWTIGRPDPVAPIPSAVAQAASNSSVGEAVNITTTFDPGTSITRVELFANDVKVGESTTAPWSLSFTPTAPGRFVITVISTTADGLKTASNDLILDVTPPAGTGAIYLDGIDDYIELPSSDELSLNVFTVEAWFRREGVGRAGSIVGSGTGVSFTPLLAFGFQLGLESVAQKLVFVDRSSSGGGSAYYGNTPIASGVWYHVAVSASNDSNGSTFRIYLNGQLELSQTSANLKRTLTVAPSFGTEFISDGSRRGAFHGLLDEVRLWSVVRTPAEIAASYQKEIYNLPSLVARWGFTESSGNTAFDSGSYQLHGILKNNPARTIGPALAVNPPPAIALQAPASHAEVNSPTTLIATIAGEPNEPLETSFYGREIVRDSDDFTIAMLPNVANYTIPANGGSLATFESMLDWIIANRVSQNIAYVGQVGGIASSNSLAGWSTASQAISRLENPQTTGLPAGIPFGVTCHQFTSTYYNQFFAASRFSGRAWCGPRPSDNSVVFFRAGGIDMGAIHLGGFSNSTWLNTLLQSHPNRRFIVFYDASAFDSTVYNYANVVLVLGGEGPGETRGITTTGQNQSRIYHSLSANYSDRPNGGDGWMRLLTFSPSKRRIHVRTFSPTRNEYETDSNSDFTIGWNVPLETPKALIASQTHYGNGLPQAHYSTNPGRRYEWHAEVSDGFTIQPSAPRDFFTALVSTDNPPSINLTSPNGGANVPLLSAVPVSAVATSLNDSIERLELLVNGLAIDSRYSASSTFFWTAGATGTYQVAVAAIDRRGLRTVSSPVQVTIGAPSLLSLTTEISAPFNGQTLFDSGTTAITATTSGNATVSKVDFYVDDILIGSDNISPYSANWPYSGIKTHRIQVLAQATNGQTALSPVVQVTIGPTPPPTVTRQPYLQMATPTAVTLCWRTQQNQVGRVWYGQAPDALTLFADEPGPKTDHSVRLTGLQPNTRYYYGVGNQNGLSSGGNSATYFNTPPIVGRAKNTRIWALGDFGTGASGQTSTRDAYYTYTGSRDTDLILMLGDNAYNSGLDSEYGSNVFAVYNSILRRSFTWPTIGNHDTAGSTTHNPNIAYYSIFQLPTAAECGGVASGTERYYSFDYANIHFVCLDSMTTDRSPAGPMATWLRSDLQSTTARWIIAFWHHPPYSKGGWDSDTNNDQIQMRTTFVPILEEFGVDLLLSGHSHNYERSWLMSGHFGLSSTFTNAMKRSTTLGRPATGGPYVKDSAIPLSDQGTVYVVAGNGGANLYPPATAPLNHPAMAVNLRTLGTMAIDVQGNQLDVRMVQASGTSTDTFTIVKPYSPTDADGDLLPDEYEAEFGLNPGNAADASRDDDGDGFTNLFEYQTGTDPNVATSSLNTRITPGAGGGYVVRFPTNTLKFYTVERCDSLSTAQWSMVAPEAAGTGSEMAVTDNTSPTVSKRFYRVKVR